MKKKVAFVNFWETFKPKDSLFYKILCKHFDIDLVDLAQAEYVFFSVWGDEHLYAPDNAVKIYFTGENRTPNFNECDYAMGFERLSFRDRYMRFPLYCIYPEYQLLEKKQIGVDKSVLDAKKGFCSFTVSNDTCHPRNEMFHLLSSYKRVDSGGKYLNNIGGRVEDKFAFDKEHKFSIVFENFSYNGYCTEKIVQAFAAQTIPIYWGDALYEETFNAKAFINVHKYKTFNEVLERVKEIDNNDDLYLEMLNHPALVSEQEGYEGKMRQLEDFLLNIFSQPHETARRRTRMSYCEIAKHREMMEIYYRSNMSIMSRLYHWIKGK